MFTYLFALVKRDRHWSRIDISQEKIGALWQSYDDIRIVAHHDIYKIDVEIQYRDIFDAVKRSDLTVIEWFVENGNNNIPHTTEILDIEKKHAIQMKDVWEAGYSVKYANHKAHPESDLLASECNDIIIEKEGVQVDNLFNNTLVSINGLIWPTVKGLKGILIPNAAAVGKRVVEPTVSLISFKRLGEIEQVGIEKDMILKIGNEPLLTSFYIKTKVKISDKTVGIVIGGYLHLLDDCYSVVGDNLIKVDLHKMQYHTRFLESHEDLQFSEMLVDGLEPGSYVGISLDDLSKEENVMEYITHQNSFIVLIDNDDICLQTTFLTGTDLPGTYTYHERPIGLVTYGNGRVLDYLCFGDNDDWRIIGSNVGHNAYVHSTYEWKNDKAFNKSKESIEPWRYPVAKLSKYYTLT